MKLAYLSCLAIILYSSVACAKPGVDAHFLDKGIIYIQPQISHQTRLQLISSADNLEYSIKASDGLGIKLLDNPAYVKGEVLNIPIELYSESPGRFYVHVQLVVTDQDGKKVRVISRVVSTETDESPQGLQKASPTDDIKLLPSTETIIQK
jgi:hypothetical protein